MEICFYKYQATGNDFVILDNRELTFPKNNTTTIARICDRKFGIGADGLILIENSTIAQYTMVYYNADGGLGSLCGNGSRAAAYYAKQLGLIAESGRFEAYDGLHEASFSGNSVKIRLADVQNGSIILNGTFIDTGSPHYVEFHQKVDSINVSLHGSNLRNDKSFAPKGTNVNFVEITGANEIKVRTYERGVEAETLSCGTGVTASALLSAGKPGARTINVSTLGGGLQVSFEKTEAGFKNIWLSGPAELVFTGKMEID